MDEHQQLDTALWDPETDPLNPYVYTAKQLQPKSFMKAHLQNKLNLTTASDKLLIGIVDDFSTDLAFKAILTAIPELITDCQFVLLNTSSNPVHEIFNKSIRANQNDFCLTADFNDMLMHQIVAGADTLLITSGTAPVNALHALRYGALPIIMQSSSIKPQVVNTTTETIKNKSANSFVLKNVSQVTIVHKIRQVMSHYQDKKMWVSLQRSGMSLF